MEDNLPSVDEIKERYGVDPDTVVIRPRGWFIVKEITDAERYAGAEIGDICVVSRDGEYVSEEAVSQPNFRGYVNDSFDPTYVYYYFSPLRNT